ncbi:hypothetical protein MK489_18040 [Myxococcota bacterium]|nr:hypothetical protein [Myxococcota bacterium]
MKVERSKAHDVQMAGSCRLLGAAVLMGALAHAAPAEMGPVEVGDRNVVAESSREVTRAGDGSVTVTGERQITEVDTGRTAGSTHTFEKSPTDQGHIWSSEGTRTNLDGAIFSRSAEGEVSRGEGTLSRSSHGVRTHDESGRIQTWDKSFEVAKVDTGNKEGVEWTKSNRIADSDGHAVSKQMSGSVLKGDGKRVRHVERSATNEATGQKIAHEHTTVHVRPMNEMGNGSHEFQRPENPLQPELGPIANVSRPGAPSNARPQRPTHPQRPNMARPGHPQRPELTRPERPQRPGMTRPERPERVRPERPQVARPERPDFTRPERPERVKRVVRVERLSFQR